MGSKDKNVEASAQGADIKKAKYFGLRGNKLHTLVTLSAGLGFFLFGTEQGVLSSLLTLPTFLETFPMLDTSTLHGSILQGTVVGVYELGCLCGCLSTIYSGDKFGRRKVIWAGSVLMVIGIVLQGAAQEVGLFSAARVIAGLGNGMITTTVPMWQSECAKPEVRGRLVITSGAMITGGIAFSYWIDYGFSFASGDAQWRGPILLQAIFGIIIVCTIMFTPESPRWLVRVGRWEEAKEVFAAFDDEPVDSEVVQRQIDEVRATLVDEEEQQAGIKKVFSQGRERRFHRACLAWWNQAFQQISGINLLTYYMGTLLETSIGLSPDISKLVAACNGTEYFMASWIPWFLIERVGRRPLMIFGALGQTVCMACLTGLVSVSDTNFAASIAAVVFLFLFNTCFAIGWLGMTWLYPAEIVPLDIRAASNALSTSSNWQFNFLVVMITPIAFHNLQYYTYTIFAAINLLIAIATYFFFPETAGRSLEEIDEIFEKANPKTPWDVVGIANRLPKRGHMGDELLVARHIYDEEKAVPAEQHEKVDNSFSEST